MRITKKKIKVVYDPVNRKATDCTVHSLLAHDIGAIVRFDCPMNHGTWKEISDDKKEDLISKITVIIYKSILNSA